MPPPPEKCSLSTTCRPMWTCSRTSSRATDYTVLTASDGEQALEVVAREHPDLVLMDVLMPKLSGFEVCERIKQDKATRLTPVVLITALYRA